MGCHNCKKDITGNFIYVGFGGLLKDPENEDCASISDQVEHFFYVTSHSDNILMDKTVELHEEFQFNGAGQSESYFCSKRCMITWMDNMIKELPDPCSNEDN